MKTRVMLAGGEYGETNDALWEGDMELYRLSPGAPVVIDNNGTFTVYRAGETAIELGPGDPRQVIYVVRDKYRDGDPTAMPYG